MLCAGIFSSVFGMNNNTQDIFAPLVDKPLINTSYDLLFNHSKQGRVMIVTERVGEMMPVMAVNSVAVQGINMITSSIVYSTNQVVVFYSGQKKEPCFTNNRLKIFAAGIAAMEAALIKHQQFSFASVKEFEKTRVYDLFLLKKILENDNGFLVTDADPYSLPKLFIETDQQWPPEKYSAALHPTSGFAVVSAALEKRKQNNIDSIDETSFVEDWYIKYDKIQ